MPTITRYPTACPPPVTPLGLLLAAIRALPVLRYALGFTALVAAVAIANQLRHGGGLTPAQTALGLFAVLWCLPVLILLERVAKLGPALRPIGVVLAWAAAAVLVATTGLLGGAVFFGWPVDLRGALAGGTYTAFARADRAAAAVVERLDPPDALAFRALHDERLAYWRRGDLDLAGPVYARARSWLDERRDDYRQRARIVGDALVRIDEDPGNALPIAERTAPRLDQATREALAVARRSSRPAAFRQRETMAILRRALRHYATPIPNYVRGQQPPAVPVPDVPARPESSQRQLGEAPACSATVTVTATGRLRIAVRGGQPHTPAIAVAGAEPTAIAVWAGQLDADGTALIETPMADDDREPATVRIVLVEPAALPRVLAAVIDPEQQPPEPAETEITPISEPRSAVREDAQTPLTS